MTALTVAYGPMLLWAISLAVWARYLVVTGNKRADRNADVDAWRKDWLPSIAVIEPLELAINTDMADLRKRGIK